MLHVCLFYFLFCTSYCFLIIKLLYLTCFIFDGRVQFRLLLINIFCCQKSLSCVSFYTYLTKNVYFKMFHYQILQEKSIRIDIGGTSPVITWYRIDTQIPSIASCLWDRGPPWKCGCCIWRAQTKCLNNKHKKLVQVQKFEAKMFVRRELHSIFSQDPNVTRRHWFHCTVKLRKE